MCSDQLGRVRWLNGLAVITANARNPLTLSVSAIHEMFLIGTRKAKRVSRSIRVTVLLSSSIHSGALINR